MKKAKTNRLSEAQGAPPDAGTGVRVVWQERMRVAGTGCVTVYGVNTGQ